MNQETQNLTLIQEKKVTWSEVTSSDEDEDEDEEQGLKIPRSPKIIRTDDVRNKKYIYSMLCLLLLFIGYLYLMLWVFHANDEGSEDKSISITARVGAFHHNHRIYRCDDRGFDCCYLYTEQHDYQFNPRYIVGKDEEGSNCPSLEDIVKRYNDYLEEYEINANCTEVQCCHVDNTKENKVRNHRDEVETLVIESEVKMINQVSTCPSIPHLMFMETHGYPDPNQDLYIMASLVGILFCWGLYSR